MENITETIINVEEEISCIINKLDNYVGLNNAKEVLKNIEKYYKVYGIYRDEQYKDYNMDRVCRRKADKAHWKP